MEKTAKRFIAMVTGAGVLILMIYTQIASDLGNAVIAWWGLTGQQEAWTWILVAGSVGWIVAYLYERG